MVERISLRLAGPDLVCTSISVPPMKSMPKFSPWKKNSRIATIDSSAETGKLMRRKRMKSNLVSSGTIRSSGMERCRRTFDSRLCYRQLLRAHPPDPPGHDQTGQGEGGEYGGDDADPERDGKA